MPIVTTCNDCGSRSPAGLSDQEALDWLSTHPCPVRGTDDRGITRTRGHRARVARLDTKDEKA